MKGFGLFKKDNEARMTDSDRKNAENYIIENSRKQLEQLIAEKGLKLNIDGTLTVGQMLQIEEGIRNGLSEDEISAYARADLEPLQMETLRLGIEDGLSPEQARMIANPEYTAKEMNKMIDNILDGIEEKVPASQTIRFDDLVNRLEKEHSHKNSDKSRELPDPKLGRQMGLAL